MVSKSKEAEEEEDPRSSAEIIADKFRTHSVILGNFPRTLKPKECVKCFSKHLTINEFRTAFDCICIDCGHKWRERIANVR